MVDAQMMQMDCTPEGLAHTRPISRQILGPQAATRAARWNRMQPMATCRHGEVENLVLGSVLRSSYDHFKIRSQAVFGVDHGLVVKWNTEMIKTRQRVEGNTCNLTCPLPTFAPPIRTDVPSQ
jgi:hypothetical protein